MTTLDERVAALEESFRQGRREHVEIADTLRDLTAQVTKLEVYLENGNGGMTVSIKQKRVKFAGSLSISGHPGRRERRRLGNGQGVRGLVKTEITGVRTCKAMATLEAVVCWLECPGSGFRGRGVR